MDAKDRRIAELEAERDEARHWIDEYRDLAKQFKAERNRLRAAHECIASRRRPVGAVEAREVSRAALAGEEKPTSIRAMIDEEKP
jgi:hypothetical protein